MREALARELEARVPAMIALRRELHAGPELSNEEHWTAEQITCRLSAAGVAVRTGIAGTGVIGLVRGTRPGKTLAIRADIDALPIAEANDVVYRSQRPGVMHACGHDGHAAIGVAVATVLAKHPECFAGNVKLLFQPAEERIAGAKRMIEAGALADPPVDAIVALHLWNYLPVGKVAVQEGATFASADEVRIVVRGRMGHGALPHQGIDSIAIAAQAVNALQTLVSREINPADSAVVTIGTIHGGTAFNIIAPEVEMRGTVRAFDSAVRAYLLERAEAIVGGVCAGMRADYVFETETGCPPCVNDARVSTVVRRAALAVVGPHGIQAEPPSTGSDDMAYFLQAVPGCYFRVGSGNPERGLNAPHHTAEFDFDEDALAVGAKVLLETVGEFLS